MNSGLSRDMMGFLPEALSIPLSMSGTHNLQRALPEPARWESKLRTRVRSVAELVSLHRFILKLHATVVPLLSAGPILKLAPIISARYFIIRKPNPPVALAPAGNPARRP